MNARWVLVMAIGISGCRSRPEATVFTKHGQLSSEERDQWFAEQRAARAKWDPKIQACLAAPVPSVPDPMPADFWPRASRTVQSAPRALSECRAEVGGGQLAGTLTMALAVSVEGDITAAGVVSERTTLTNPAFAACVRKRFCFLKAWPGQAATVGELPIQTEKIQ